MIPISAFLLTELLDRIDRGDTGSALTLRLHADLRLVHEKMMGSPELAGADTADKVRAARSHLRSAWVSFQYAWSTANPVVISPAGTRYGAALMVLDDALAPSVS